MRLSLFSLAACLTSSPLLAHPGHGVTQGDSAVHYLIEPLHIGPVLLLIAAGIATALWFQRLRLQARRLREVTAAEQDECRRLDAPGQ
jgi:hypothetical protein